MKLISSIIIVMTTLLIISCGSSAERAQKRSYEADENVAKERLRLVDEYKKCVEDAKDNETKIEACDSYLKAAEALR